MIRYSLANPADLSKSAELARNRKTLYPLSRTYSETSVHVLSGLYTSKALPIKRVSSPMSFS